MISQLKQDVQKPCERLGQIETRAVRILQDYDGHLKYHYLTFHDILSEYVDDLLDDLYVCSRLARIIIQRYEDRRLVANHGASVP